MALIEARFRGPPGVGNGGYVAGRMAALLGRQPLEVTLRRGWSGRFDVADAMPFDAVDRANQATLDAALLPVEAALDLPGLRATDAGAVRLGNGNPGQVLDHADYGTEVWVSHQDRAIAIGRYLGGEVHPSRIFVRPQG